ncbi:YbaN family protein [Dendrosporobacter sp. 1207_IL3150]|uniref:YbaN family protein n=1 Tax=Dendrosporobacter sp. 1207_IL3150 TaxID=3084054 RepID=UPI002FD8A9C7
MYTGKLLKKYILITVGCLSLVLGIIGIFIPLLPTVPFLLLTAYCFTRSSNRMYNWLINHKTFGSYIYHYQTYRSISRKSKLLALTFLWVSLGFSMFLLPSLYLHLLLVTIGTGVTLYILSLRTLK